MPPNSIQVLSHGSSCIGSGSSDSGESCLQSNHSVPQFQVPKGQTRQATNLVATQSSVKEEVNQEALPDLRPLCLIEDEDDILSTLGPLMNDESPLISRQPPRISVCSSSTHHTNPTSSGVYKRFTMPLRLYKRKPQNPPGPRPSLSDQTAQEPRSQSEADLNRFLTAFEIQHKEECASRERKTERGFFERIHKRFRDGYREVGSTAWEYAVKIGKGENYEREHALDAAELIKRLEKVAMERERDEISEGQILPDPTSQVERVNMPGSERRRETKGDLLKSAVMGRMRDACKNRLA